MPLDFLHNHITPFCSSCLCFSFLPACAGWSPREHSGQASVNGVSWRFSTSALVLRGSSLSPLSAESGFLSFLSSLFSSLLPSLPSALVGNELLLWARGPACPQPGPPASLHVPYGPWRVLWDRLVPAPQGALVPGLWFSLCPRLQETTGYFA